MRRSKSPSYDRRRSPLRRDRRDFPVRRRRSFSRERFDGNRGRRSSPGFKRFRRDDDHYDRYDRGSPYRRGGGHDRERDAHDRYHDRREGPESYREFIMNLPNDVTPEEAHRRYQTYLADWHGSVVKAEFEQLKEEEWMKTKYDPRTILQIIEKHKTHGVAAAQDFAKAMEPGKELDISSASFEQGAPLQPVASDATKESGQKGFFAPRVCWSRERIFSDLKLSAELVQKLDSEKELTSPLQSLLESEGQPQSRRSLEMGLLAEGTLPTEGNASEEKGEEEEGSGEADPTAVKKLDLFLAYLWRVHMIDYYSGHELNDKEYEETKCRMLRPSKEQTSDKQTDERMLEELKVRVDAFWRERVKNGDPLQAKAQTARVEKGVEDFIESKVVQIDSKKWGNKLSNKMFVGKEFVIKHIRVKHSAAVEEEKERILDEVYYDNFRKDQEEQERKMTEERERAMRFGPQAMEGSYHGGYPDGFGHGGQSMMAGQGMMGNPIVPAPMMGAPLGQMLMPAPGAGPMGPFVLQPVPSGGGMSPMDIGGPASGAGRGRTPDSQGTAGAGRFVGSQSWSGPRDYYDLDAPQNNRAVLDYGDL